jgi:hypothetical protein
MTTTYTYPNAIIYGVVCNKTNEIYIGSTVRTLEQRMSLHRHGTRQYNNWVVSGCIGKCPYRCCSIQILNRGNYKYFEIESYPCDTKTELYLREGNIQIQYKNEFGSLCINVCIAGAHARAGGRVEYDKQRYIENVDTIRKQKKQYRIDNADTIREKKKQWYKNNADTILEKQKQYDANNATKIAMRMGVKHDCGVCGGRYTHGNRLHHIRTHKHQRAMQCATQASAHHD